MAMPWTDARAFLSSATHLERERLLHTAVVARVAQAEEKAWKEWVKAVSDR
jgi:hypothetical protein